LPAQRQVLACKTAIKRKMMCATLSGLIGSGKRGGRAAIVGDTGAAERRIETGNRQGKGGAG
jgi:hypothetical protein